MEEKGLCQAAAGRKHIPFPDAMRSALCAMRFAWRLGVFAGDIFGSGLSVLGILS